MVVHQSTQHAGILNYGLIILLGRGSSLRRRRVEYLLVHQLFETTLVPLVSDLCYCLSVFFFGSFEVLLVLSHKSLPFVRHSLVLHLKVLECGTA